MRAVARVAVLLSAGLLITLTGCQDRQKFTATILNPLNLKLPFLPYQQPVRIGMVHAQKGIFDPATWDIARVGSPWTPLALRLQRKLGQPVQIADLEPFQVAAHLQSGRIDFAFLAAEDYVKLTDEFGELGKVIAVSEVQERQGLIVARTFSDIKSLADVRGRRFAFGPAGDPVLDIGAREALEAAEVPVESLQRELLPVPNSYQHHISSNEAAYEIVYGLGTDVGVIEKSEYEAYPDKGGNFLMRTFSKANFRVLGETKAVRVNTIPEGPFLAAADTDPHVVQAVQKFLLSAHDKDPAALSAMGLAAFRAPPADVGAALRRLAAADAPAGQ